MIINKNLKEYSGAQPNSLWIQVVSFFPPELRQLLSKISYRLSERIIEIRLRIGQPIELNLGQTSVFLSINGEIVSEPGLGWPIDGVTLKRVITAFTTGSFYALEEELTLGYFALPGGHRVGFTGRTLIESGRIRLIRDISSINFRIARSIREIARPLWPLLWQDRFLKTVIISPPAAGKTTLLREIIREISSGIPELGIPGWRVGLVDERSEISGSYQGEPQLAIGPRTDVLDGCPKSEGVYLLLRVMNPQLIAVDEIGGINDFRIVEDIVNAGVSLIATAHARNLEEALARPGLGRILNEGFFERVITLSSRMGAGTIESVRAGVTGPELWN